MNKPIIRYVEFYSGCTVTTNTPREIMKQHGTDNVKLIRNATKKDVAWVESMGGPRDLDGRIAKETEHE